LTELFGVQPHLEGTKGSDGPIQDMPLPEGFWAVNTRSVDSASLDDHIAELDRILGDSTAQIALARGRGWRATLWLSWLSQDLGGDLLISPAAMRKLAAWGIELDVRRSSRSTDRDLSDGLGLRSGQT
jgi:hypothetical protein